MKKRFIIEIEVDEKKLPKKYPNFQFNYSDINEFIQTEALVSASTDSDSWKRCGYRKRLVKEVA